MKPHVGKGLPQEGAEPFVGEVEVGVVVAQFQRLDAGVSELRQHLTGERLPEERYGRSAKLHGFHLLSTWNPGASGLRAEVRVNGAPQSARRWTGEGGIIYLANPGSNRSIHPFGFPVRIGKETDGPDRYRLHQAALRRRLPDRKHDEHAADHEPRGQGAGQSRHPAGAALGRDARRPEKRHLRPAGPDLPDVVYTGPVRCPAPGGRDRDSERVRGTAARDLPGDLGGRDPLAAAGVGAGRFQRVDTEQPPAAEKLHARALPPRIETRVLILRRSPREGPGQTLQGVDPDLRCLGRRSRRPASGPGRHRRGGPPGDEVPPLFLARRVRVDGLRGQPRDRLFAEAGPLGADRFHGLGPGPPGVRRPHGEQPALARSPRKKGDRAGGKPRHDPLERGGDDPRSRRGRHPGHRVLLACGHRVRRASWECSGTSVRPT